MTAYRDRLNAGHYAPPSTEGEPGDPQPKAQAAPPTPEPEPKRKPPAKATSPKATKATARG